MKSRYLTDGEIPEYDQQINALVKAEDDDPWGDGGGTMAIAIENNGGVVYRVIETSGMGEYLRTVNALANIGLSDLLQNSSPSKEGFDSRFHPQARQPHTEQAQEWTDAELEAAVDAYLWMLSQESQGKPFSKAEVNRKLREGRLSGRSQASIEYRMQNISAVMEELCLGRVSGYLPAKNVGTGVKDRIRSVLAEKEVFEPEDYAPSNDDRILARRVEKLRKGKLDGVPRGIAAPERTSINSVTFNRDPLVRAWILNNAKGVCEGCLKPAPFKLEDGTPFLEVHHVLPLANGGADQISNAVALCPNCHRRCHLADDKKQFTASLYDSISRLVLTGRAGV